MSLKVSGRVTFDGAAAPSAVVEVHNATGDVVDQVQVDSDGRFTYHLAPGSWSLVAWDAHGHRGRREVILVDEDESIDVPLVQT